MINTVGTVKFSHIVAGSQACCLPNISAADRRLARVLSEVSRDVLEVHVDANATEKFKEIPADIKSLLASLSLSLATCLLDQVHKLLHRNGLSALKSKLTMACVVEAI